MRARPCPIPAAQELVDDLFGRTSPARAAGLSAASWRPTIDVPALHLTAEHDLIAPAATAPAGEVVAIASGHVGMIVGSARQRLHEALRAFPRCKDERAEKAMRVGQAAPIR